ncbi:hypothetical protein F4810DRAFT_702675 [Camillea tinctor]|nr:hypothetical protein F4810DRAFT_702675 [Camillea tinctor]
MPCNDDRGSPAHPIPTVKDSSGATRVKKESRPSIAQLPLSSTRRTVCDHCRRRRIRCDGQFPCQQCTNATLQCKREHVPKKRGPKRGYGRVINELRAREKAARGPGSGYCSDVDTDGMSSAPISTTATDPPSPHSCFAHGMSSSPSDSCRFSKPTTITTTSTTSALPFSPDGFQPNCRSYLHLLPQCIDLYYEHIYPIMPLLYMPHIRAIISRPLARRDEYLLYSLCALTCFHMSGRSLSAAPPAGTPSWEAVGRFFLDACVGARRCHDFIEEQSLSGVISSFWLSTSCFEINQSRKSWFYLREALTLALDLRLDDDAMYNNNDDAAAAGGCFLPPHEILCRLRVFWILFVTERSFAILRNKPLTLRKTPRLPAAGHDYEAPDIHAGFMKLVESYVPLDESFVNAWNDGSDPRVSHATYLGLQRLLAKPPILESRTTRRRRRNSRLQSQTTIVGLLGAPGCGNKEEENGDGDGDTDANMDEYVWEPAPTAIQKADLLMTQQWLRLIVWQSSFRQGLLSTAAVDQSMTFAFPLCIARDTASILQSLPSTAIEVHGMGIFEKIFEIGTWCVK